MGVRFAFGEPDEMTGILADAVSLVEAGAIVLPITRTYPLSDAAAVHRDSASAASFVPVLQ